MNNQILKDDLAKMLDTLIKQDSVWTNEGLKSQN